VQYPNRYTTTKSGGGALSSGDDLTMVASPGTITEAGTTLTAARMNNIETGIEQAAPTGTLGRHCSKWVPDGWLVRDGSTLNRTTYADLFDALTNPRTVTVTIASPAVFSLTGHGFTAGDPVRFETTGALLTGLSTSTTYYVISAGLTADEFEVSTSVGGAAVNTSGSQSGTHTIRFFGVAGVGDGSTTYTLPDDRGYFERNWDGERGVDTDRVFGSYQEDDVKPHAHNISAGDGASDVVQGALNSGGLYKGLGGPGGGNTTSTLNDYNGIQIIQNSTGVETIPKNRAYLPTIKY
jgi:hypothetical protein